MPFHLVHTKNKWHPKWIAEKKITDEIWQINN